MNENKREVTIDLARFEELVKAETTVHLIADAFVRADASYAALDTVKLILGVEEKKDETV